MHVIFGNGQVGRVLAQQLRARELAVRVVCRTEPRERRPGVEYLLGDARDRTVCRRACGGADVVYGCLNAPYHRWPTDLPPLQDALVDGVESAGAKLVMLENVYMYGPHDGPLTESLPHRAVESKGIVRGTMSDALQRAHVQGRIRVVRARAADFFGPGVTDSQLGARVFQPLVAGRPAQVVGNPDTLHSYAYVDDVATGLAALGLDARADGRVAPARRRRAHHPRAGARGGAAARQDSAHLGHASRDTSDRRVAQSHAA